MGAGVGSPVGAAVALFVSSGVGSLVGDGVGLPVGAGVGLPVGAGVTAGAGGGGAGGALQSYADPPHLYCVPSLHVSLQQSPPSKQQAATLFSASQYPSPNHPAFAHLSLPQLSVGVGVGAVVGAVGFAVGSLVGAPVGGTGPLNPSTSIIGDTAQKPQPTLDAVPSASPLARPRIRS